MLLKNRGLLLHEVEMQNFIRSRSLLRILSTVRNVAADVVCIRAPDCRILGSLVI
jgi:hypothetical protein